MSSAAPVSTAPTKSFPARFVEWLAGFGLATTLVIVDTLAAGILHRLDDRLA